MMETILRDIRVNNFELELVLEGLGSFIVADYQHTFVSKRVDEDKAAWTWNEIGRKECLKDLPREKVYSFFNVVHLDAPPHLAASHCFHLSQLEEHLLKHPEIEEVKPWIQPMFKYLRENPPPDRKPYSLEAIRQHLYNHPKVKSRHQGTIDRIISVLEDGWPIEGTTECGPKVRIPSPIPETFHRGDYSKLARWKIAPTGSIVRLEDSLVKQLQSGERKINLAGRLTYVRQRTAEEILGEKYVLLDIEKPLFGTEEEEISWTALINYQNGKVMDRTIYSLYPVKKEINGFKIKSCSDEKSLVGQIVDDVRAADSKVIVAYNVPYDAIQLREAGEFDIGEEGAKPRKVATTPFFERIGIKGRDVLDLLRWAKTQFEYLPNHKLVTISKHLLGESKFEKEITYEQQRELELVCKNELAPENTSEGVRKLLQERSASEIIASYVSKDVQVLTEIMNSSRFRAGVEDIAFMSQQFKIDFFLLMHDPNRIQDFLEKRFFEEKGIFKDIIYPHYQVFQKYETKVKAKLQRTLSQHFSSDQDGLVKDVVKAYFPLGRVLRQDLGWFFPEVKSFFQYTDLHQSDPQRQFFLAQYEDALSEWMWQDYAAYLYEKGKLKRLIKGKDEKEFNIVCQGLAERCRQEGLEDKLNKMSIPQRDFFPLIAEKHIYFMQQQEWDQKEFYERFIQWGRVRQRNRIIWGAHETGWETYEHRLGSFCEEVQEYLEKNHLNIVHAQGRYLYLTGNVSALSKSNCHLVPVDRIPLVYQAGDSIYYQKLGTMFGFKKQSTPSNKMNLWEMGAVGSFLSEILHEKPDSALKEIWYPLKALGSAGVAKEELIWFSRVRSQYSAYVNGQRTELANKEKWEPDWEKYIEKESKRAKELVKPLLGKEAKLFVADALSSQPKNGLEYYLKRLEKPQLSLF